MAVFKRNNKWYYAFCIRGVRYRKAVPEARTKFQASQAETKAKEAVFANRYGDEPSDVTLKGFFEKVFLPWSKQNKRSWKNDESRSKPILAHFKNKMMREIRKEDVEQYKQLRRRTYTERGDVRSPASVDRELQLLSRIFSFAIERGEVRENPCRGIKLLARHNLVTRYLTPDEEEKLMTFLSGRRAHVRDILTINLYTGMRRTEILTLHKGQIDFLRNSIELTKTKSGRPRSVPIHSDLKPLLERLCDQAGESGYLFVSKRTGKPIIDIKTAWKHALEDAGIPHIPFHCAGRHTFGTRAVDNGASLSAVKEVMGHMDIRTTMRYVHATEEGKRKAVELAVSGRVKSQSAPNMPQTEETTP